MDDALTQAVVDYQKGLRPLGPVRDLVLLEAFHHLSRYRRKGEDEVSEFLLEFHGKIEGLLGRFRPQGLPFRHFLLRTLRWQWTTFRAERSRRRREDLVVVDAGLRSCDEVVAEAGGPEAWDLPGLAGMSGADRRRLVLLTLKASPWVEDPQLEAVSRHTGVDLAWLQACRNRLVAGTDRRRRRREVLVDKRGEAFYRRIMAEDEARREADPERRQVHERRARLYRQRLASLARQQEVLSTAPTHLEVATVLGMPKGSVDSGLYHLKRGLAGVYDGVHDDSLSQQQRPQKARA